MLAKVFESNKKLIIPLLIVSFFGQFLYSFQFILWQENKDSSLEPNPNPNPPPPLIKLTSELECYQRYSDKVINILNPQIISQISSNEKEIIWWYCSFSNICFGPDSTIEIFGRNKDQIQFPTLSLAPGEYKGKFHEASQENIPKAWTNSNTSPNFHYLFWRYPSQGNVNHAIQIVWALVHLIRANEESKEKEKKVGQDDLEISILDSQVEERFLPFFEAFSPKKNIHRLNLGSLQSRMCIRRGYLGVPQRWFHGVNSLDIDDLTYLSNSLFKFYNIQPADSSQKQQQDEKTFMFTQRTKDRLLLNYPLFEAALLTNSTSQIASIDLVSLHELSLGEQLEKINAMNGMIGVHGAALTLMIFLPPRSTVVQLCPYAADCSEFQRLATVLGHSYHHIQLDWDEGSFFGPSWSGVDISQKEAIDKRLAELSSMKDPYPYRIAVLKGQNLQIDLVKHHQEISKI